jgi:hypothetical protein
MKEEAMRALVRLAAWLPCAAVTIVVAGCGSSSAPPGNTIDCTFLSANNCWKTTVQAAATCLPAKTDPPGTLSADNTTCTFANGIVVTFDSPIVLPSPAGSMPAWNFSVTNNGGPCLRLQESDANHKVVTTTAGKVSVTTDPDSYGITCPDGTSYSTTTANALGLLTCDAGPLGGLPGIEDSTSTMPTTTVSVTLVGVGGGDGSLQAFHCTK